jgi:hypothetical protein
MYSFIHHIHASFFIVIHTSLYRWMKNNFIKSLFFRFDIITNRLRHISNCTPDELIKLIGDSYRNHYRIKCRGICWYHSLHTLQVVTSIYMYTHIYLSIQFHTSNIYSYVYICVYGAFCPYHNFLMNIIVILQLMIFYICSQCHINQMLQFV